MNSSNFRKLIRNLRLIKEGKLKINPETKLLETVEVVREENNGVQS